MLSAEDKQVLALSGMLAVERKPKRTGPVNKVNETPRKAKRDRFIIRERLLGKYTNYQANNFVHFT